LTEKKTSYEKASVPSASPSVERRKESTVPPRGTKKSVKLLGHCVASWTNSKKTEWEPQSGKEKKGGRVGKKKMDETPEKRKETPPLRVGKFVLKRGGGLKEGGPRVIEKNPKAIPFVSGRGKERKKKKKKPEGKRVFLAKKRHQGQEKDECEKTQVEEVSETSSEPGGLKRAAGGGAQSDPGKNPTNCV